MPVNSLRPLIIEFTGIPGAGKTTICQHLDAMKNNREHDNAPGAAVCVGRYGRNHLPWLGRKLIAILRIIQCLIMQPSISLLFLKYGLTCRPLSSHKVKCILTALSFIQKLEFEQTTLLYPEQKLIIIDQGFIQMLGSIAVPANNPNLPDCCRLVQAIIPGRINGLVWLDCSLEIVLSRIQKRTHGKSRFDLWTDDEAKNNMLVMKKILEKAVQTAKIAGIPVLRLDSSRPVKENSIVVAEWLRNF